MVPSYNNTLSIAAICDSKITKTGACQNAAEGGRSQLILGSPVTASSGQCNEPEVCSNCGSGFYADGPKCKSKIPLNINTFQRKTESAIDRIIMYISIKQFKCRTVLVCFSIPFTRLMSLSFNVFLLKSTVTGLNGTIIIDVEF